MTELTDDLLRRRLADRAAAGSAPALSAIARSVTASGARRPAPWSGRWAVLGSIAALLIVAVAFVGGLLNRTGPPAVAPRATVATPGMTSISPVPASAIPVRPAAAAWESIGWTGVSARAFAVARETTVTGAIAVGDGFLAIGYTVDPTPLVGHLWASPDGRTWKRVDGDWLVGLIPDAIVRVGDRIALIGRRGGPGATDPIELWISDDGVTWTEGPSPAGSAGVPPAVTGGVDGILARFGGRTYVIDADLRAWTATTDAWAGDVQLGRPADGDGFWIQPGATGMGDAGAVRTGAIWTSPDGTTWSPAALADPGGAVTGVFRVGGGWVAIGSASTSGCRPCFGPIDMTRIAWFSADGHTWTRLPAVGPPQESRFLGAQFVGDGHRLIAIGSIGPTAALTETVDGTTWTPIAIDPAVPAPWDSGDGVYIGRHGLVALPGGVQDAAGPTAWWGEAVEAPSP